MYRLARTTSTSKEHVNDYTFKWQARLARWQYTRPEYGGTEFDPGPYLIPNPYTYEIYKIERKRK